jgi:hypothetical protein
MADEFVQEVLILCGKRSAVWGLRIGIAAKPGLAGRGGQKRKEALRRRIEAELEESHLRE